MEYLAFYEQHWSAYPDVISTLNDLKKNISIGIITNGNKVQQLKKLTNVNILHFFENNLIIISNEVGFSKPSLEIFAVAEQRANTANKNILFIGDSYSTDIEPALKSNWNALIIDRARANSDETTINGLGEIANFV